MHTSKKPLELFTILHHGRRSYPANQKERLLFCIPDYAKRFVKGCVIAADSDESGVFDSMNVRVHNGECTLLYPKREAWDT